MKFSVDDKGNVVHFYEQMIDGSWEKCAQLDREAGADANSLRWLNTSGEELEEWAKKNGYADEILEANLKV